MSREKYKDRPAAGNDGLLDGHDVARILKMSLFTIRNWRSRGQGPKYVKIGSAVRYWREDVMCFVSSLCKGAGKPLNA